MKRPCVFCALLVATAVAAIMPNQALPQQGEETQSPSVKVNEQNRIDIVNKDVEITALLNALSQQYRRNIVVSKSVKGKVSVNLYNVTFYEALEAILHPNGFAYREKGPFIYVYTAKELAEILKAERTAVVRVFKLNYIPAADAKSLIEPLKSAIGQITVSSPAGEGIPSGAESGTGGNSYAMHDVLVVYDYPENIAQMAKVIKEVDVRPQQVLIEATILSAQLDDDNELGIDFNALSGLDFRSVTPVSTGYNTVATGNLPINQFDDTTIGVRTDFNADFSNTGGLSIGIMKNNIGLFIRALEDVTDVTVLANPKVLALNKQRAEVIVGNRDGYLTQTVTETQTIQSVEFLETGTQLLFRPFISSDGYIRMEIHPEDSDGQVDPAGLPHEQTTEVTSNIIVKDGHTIVIGGLFRESTQMGRSQVPVLGNVPVLGAAFRRQLDQTVREEGIILITPHIVKEPQDYEEAEAILKDIERIRVGARQGLMFHGRERLAQAHLRSARSHYRAGRLQDALWDLDCALVLHSNFLEAIKFREKVLAELAYKRDYHEGEDTSARRIIQRLIMRDMGLNPEWEFLPKPSSPPEKPKPPAGKGRQRTQAEKAADLASAPDANAQRAELAGQTPTPEASDQADKGNPDASAAQPDGSEQKPDADAQEKQHRQDRQQSAQPTEQTKPGSDGSSAAGAGTADGDEDVGSTSDEGGTPQQQPPDESPQQPSRTRTAPQEDRNQNQQQTDKSWLDW